MTDWINSTNKRERNTMLRFARCGRSLSFRCYAFATIGLSFYICFNLLKLYQNIHQPQRSFIYHFVYPYNAQKSPNYEITFVIQLSGGIYTGLINCTVDSFISMILLHVYAQLINLRMALNNLVDELSNKSISYPKFKEGLAAVAVRHKHLIRLFNLCIYIYRVSQIIWDNTRVQISMAYSVYECKWYNIPAKDAKNLMVIAYGSLIPLKLTAGKFGNFSMELFGAMVKTAMGYFSMLLTIKD
ncbi:uncharacterized protein LOC115239600 [Formica exsecta]|uniref:uncharacterized protein LOC115239600 n=1 Tax=Formica exsecta TaxID=72781 RepID=UPI00114344D5|nr:uncharacterized protein LOC115239600 [Formica exsecta]